MGYGGARRGAPAPALLVREGPPRWGVHRGICSVGGAQNERTMQKEVLGGLVYCSAMHGGVNLWTVEESVVILCLYLQCSILGISSAMGMPEVPEEKMVLLMN